MAIISAKYAAHLIRQGRATQRCMTYSPLFNVTYGVIDRHDKQRTDHFLVGNGDLREE